MNKELLFSLRKEDFIIEDFKGSGAGGQNRNKRSTGQRIRHLESGAVAEDCTERSQYQNRQKAFLKLVKTPEFTKWHRLECAKRLGIVGDIDKEVAELMLPKNLRIEIRDESGKWITLEE